LPQLIALSTPALEEGLRTAPSVAAYTAWAEKLPEQGGRFYAWSAYKNCMSVMSTGSAASLEGRHVPHWAVRAIQAEKSRCGEVGKTIDSDWVQTHILVRDGHTDPYLQEAMTGQRWQPVDAINAAVASGSAAYLAAALDRHGTSLLAERLQSLPEDRDINVAAVQWVTCEVRGECVGTWRAAVPCAVFGACSSQDYREQLKSRFSENQQTKLASAVATLRSYLTHGR